MKLLHILERKLVPRRSVLMFGPASSVLPSAARRLVANREFRQAFIEASDYVEARRGWSPWREIDNDPPPPGVTASERNFVQEVIFQLALFRAFRKLDLEYDAIAGISLGDAAAGHAAGLLTLEETLDVMCETIRAVLCAGGGDLVVVQGRPSSVRQVIGDVPAEMIFDWSVRSVWAVPDECLRLMLRRLRAASIAYMKLDFRCLSHTDRVDREGMYAALKGLPSRSLNRRLYSTLNGGTVDGSITPDRWVRCISEPVRLEDMWRRMRKDAATDIIYIGSVPADRDLFGDLARHERPTSFTAVERLIPLDDEASVAAMRERRPKSSAMLSVLRSASFARNPYPYYADWLEKGPVHSITERNVFAILGYDAVAHVLKQQDQFSSLPFSHVSPNLMGADPPLHTRTRRLLSPFFTRERQVARESSIHAITASTINDLRRRGTFDAVLDVAARIPLLIATDWLGLQETQAIMLGMMAPEEVSWPDVERALKSEGLIPDVLAAGELTKEEVAQLIPFLMIAGVTTSRDLLLMTLYNLIYNRELLEQVAADPALVPAVVEEMLRLEPPVQGVIRRALCDTEVEGVPIPEGGTLWVWIASANRDPARFERPDDVIPGRTGARHMSFSHGPHLCMGRHLGRMQAEIMVAALVPELKTIRPTVPPDFMFTSIDEQPPWLRGMRSWQLSYTMRNAR